MKGMIDAPQLLWYFPVRSKSPFIFPIPSSQDEVTPMKILTATIATLLLLISGIVHAGQAVQDYSGTINMFKGNQTVAPYFNSAYGYAVFPTIGKGAIGIGGAHGKGQVYTGGAVTGFTSMTQITIGFQLGGQAYSEIIFFKDKRAYEDFTSGNYEFDAQASAVAVTSSAQASVGTTGTGASAGPGGGAGTHADTSYRKGTLTFVMGKGGLMFESSIGGQKFNYKQVGSD
jgi:lipid-binding SYLF domain-containing protein